MSRPAAATAPNVRDGYQPLTATALGLTLLTCLFWGGTPVAVHYSVDQLPPVFVAGVRFVLATAFMLVWCRVEGSRLKLEAGQSTPVLVAGVLLFLQIGLFTVGISQTSASHATVLINTFVFFVAAIEHFVTRELRLTGANFAGLVLAAIGGLTIMTATDAAASAAAQDPPSRLGDALLAGSALLLAIKIVYTKHALKRIEPGKLMLWHDVVGVVLFLAWSGLFEADALATAGLPRLPTVLGLLYQGLVVSGFCFATQALLLKRHAASSISVFSVTTPLFGIGAAFLLRGDPLSPWLLLAGICVAAGIFLVNWRPGAA